MAWSAGAEELERVCAEGFCLDESRIEPVVVAVFDRVCTGIVVVVIVVADMAR